MYKFYFVTCITFFGISRTAANNEYEQYDISTGKIKFVSNLHSNEIPSSKNYWTDETIEKNKRSRREILDIDTRFPIDTKNNSAKFPFDTVVRLSTGCSGTLISDRHVLTAAHCVHDGHNYVNVLKNLQVGLLRDFLKKPRRKSTAVSKKSRRKQSNRVRRATEDQKTRRSRRKTERASRRLKKDKREIKRKSGQKLPKERKSFKWIKVKLMNIPNLWKKTSKDNNTNPNNEYDYAVLTLKTPIAKNYMRITVSPELENLKPHNRVHFSGFDLSRIDRIGYRFCMIQQQSEHLIYNQCDAENGSAGAGMYVRYYVPALKVWHRKIIGVFIGNYNSEYNVGMRITKEKFENICYWVHADKNKCEKLRDEQLLRRPYINLNKKIKNPQDYSADPLINY